MESKHVDKDVKLSLTKQLELLNPFELNNIMQMKLKKLPGFGNIFYEASFTKYTFPPVTFIYEAIGA